MSPAAQARAAAEARMIAEAEAAEAAVTTAPEIRIAPARSPVPDVPAIAPRPVSAAAQQRAFLIASSAGGVLAASGVDLTLHGANDDGAAGSELEGEAAKILLRMQDDRRQLKAIQSIERKVEFKRGLLPAYAGWCAGVIAAGAPPQIAILNELFTTVMAWRIDVGDYLEALAMAEHCFRYGLPMPERFKRGTAGFVVEQISDAAIVAYEAGDPAAQAFPAAVLPMLQDLVETYDEDLHDEISAKLQRAIGMAIMAGANIEDEEDLLARRRQTLACYLRALQLNPKVGVKKQVEQLQRQLNKTPPANAAASPDQDASDLKTLDELLEEEQQREAEAVDAAANESDTPPPEEAG